jgi:S-adenosylmethionine:tRNA ribosyltransferase-isomerase
LLDLSDYDYHLPPALIAQEPLPRRDDSRLLVLYRRDGAIEHRRFRDLPGFLQPGDLLAVNDTRVFPARLAGRGPGGGAVEILLLEAAGEPPHAWRALLRPGRAGRPGRRLTLARRPDVGVETLGREGEAFLLELRAGERKLAVEEVLELAEAAGEVPLPPYIARRPEDPRGDADRRRYQTIYARRPGAAAAPTAGLHFTEELLSELESKAVLRTAVTLHVGLGTFKPLRDEEIAAGRLHGERAEVSAAAAEALLETRRRGGRIVAAGTTTVRALESFARAGSVAPFAERTTLFIRPGHDFRLVDALITNFHLPRSSLLVLVSAFAGRERVLAAYEEAVRRGYRFYSYGDAMLIV